MNKCTLCALPLLLVAAAGCGSHHPPDVQRLSRPEIHYSPAENLEALDAAMFRNSRSSIDMCAYSLTDHALVQALRSAAQRGVRIRIYLDQIQTRGELGHERRRVSDVDGGSYEGEASTLTNMEALRTLANTPNVTVKVKHSTTLMHLKSYLVDSTVLRSGSANYSPTGEKRQDNDLSFTRDTQSVKAFSTNFEEIWNRPDNTPIEAMMN
jgi:phosphatidylserine/phosphatidylglycerophosphate/cardiolipin synthase-like enzyme